MSDNFGIALCYLLDGTVDDWEFSASRFLDSYKLNPAGRDHRVCLVLRGFETEEEIAQARHLFEAIPHSELLASADKDEVGVYGMVAAEVQEDVLCFVRADCMILGDLWMAKLAVNLEMPDVGVVGVAGSYGLSDADGERQQFPNVHLCTDVFAARRDLLLTIFQDIGPAAKLGMEEFECGRMSLTERVLARGKKVLVIGRNGRGYSPRWWPRSDTFCRGTQSNLLISTKSSRAFARMRWNDKLRAAYDVWGIYLDDNNANLLP